MRDDGGLRERERERELKRELVYIFERGRPGAESVYAVFTRPRGEG